MHSFLQVWTPAIGKMFQLQKSAAAINGAGNKIIKCTWRFSRSLKTAPRFFQKAEEPILGRPYSEITIGIPKETFMNEKRVAVVPQTVTQLVKKGFKINVEENAGVEAKYLNEDYSAAGANVVAAKDAYGSDIVLKIRAPDNKEIEMLREGNTLYSMIYPAQNKDLVNTLMKKKHTVFAMDCVPRISRAQAFDVLSSMSNISGYKAVVEAANNFGRFFTGLWHKL